jgi:hypothetical protein
MYTWILSLMVSLQPSAPWLDTYWETAVAIGRAAEERPLFRGELGKERTAALLVAVAYYESHFDAGALGDCRKDAPRSLARCQSVGLYQISKANAPADELLDRDDASRHALRLFATSFRICRERPVFERLAWYAAGGNGCDRRLELSAHRMSLASRLMREHPPIRSRTPSES